MSPGGSVGEIVAELVRLELVPADRQRELQALAADCPEPMRFWRLLVERGLLTAYQANAAMNGQWSALVLGPYRLLERIGVGTQGEVFRARHAALGRICALKVIELGKWRTPGLVERFFHEAKLAARLQHPNIVAVYDAGQEGQRCYYAMEYVQGKPLGQLVRERGALPVPLACEYIRQVASGLQYAAHLGLVHGNLKPSNLIVSRDPVTQKDIVKILDFGLGSAGIRQPLLLGAAGTIQREPRSGPAGQNPVAVDYLAPEQLTPGAPVDIRADIYSLGCTFYYLLTGRPPVSDGGVQEKVSAKLQGLIPPIQSVRAEVPAALVDILNKMLAVQPNQRYQSPAEVFQALTPWTLGAGLSGSSAATLEPDAAASVPPALPLPPEFGSGGLVRRTKRNLAYLIVGLAVTFLLGAILTIVVIHTMFSRSRQQEAVVNGQVKPPDSDAGVKPTQPAEPTRPSDPAPDSEPAIPELPLHLPTKLLDNPIPVGKIRSLAVEATGRRVAILEELGQVNVYDFATSRLLVSFPVAGGRFPLALCWCGAHELAIVYSDGVQILDPLRREVLRECRFEFAGKPRTTGHIPVAYSPYAEKLALVWNGTVVLVDCVSMRYHLVKGRVPEALAVAFRDRTGSCSVLASDGLYEAGEEIRRVELPKPEPQAEPLPVGTLSWDGNWAALAWRLPLAGRPKYRICVWSRAGTGNGEWRIANGEIAVLTTAAPPQRLAILPHASPPADSSPPVLGHLVALYGGRAAVLYELPRGEIRLVQRSEERADQLVAAGLTSRAALAGEGRLWLCELLPPAAAVATPSVLVASEREDPPASVAVRLPLPLPGEEKPLREKLRESYAAAYRQLPASRLDLARRLAEHGRQAETAAEVLACALELAAISGQAADLTGLQQSIGLLEDRLLAEPPELLQLLVLQEFTQHFLQRKSNVAAEKVLALWEQLAETFTLQLDLESAADCWRQAEAFASNFPSLAAPRGAYLRRQVELCTKAMEDRPAWLELRKALQQGADAPQTRRLLGIFFVRRLQRYARGFQHLAICGEPALERVARLELDPPKSVPQMVELADAWVQAGQGVQPDSEARWYYERAAYWYGQAYRQQLQENAVLAPVVAERWKKAIARFFDVPGPGGAAIVHDLGKWLHANSLVGPVLVNGRFVVCAGQQVKRDQPILLALHLDTGKVQTWNLEQLPRWLAGEESQSTLAGGFQDGIFWLDLAASPSAPLEVNTPGVRVGVLVPQAAKLIVLTSDTLLAYPLGRRVPLQERPLRSEFGTFAPRLAVAPDGQRLAVVGKKPRQTIPRVFLLDGDAKLLNTFDYAEKSNELPQAAFSADGRWLAVALHKELRPFTAHPDKLVPQGVVALPQRATALAAHPKKLQFLVGMEDGSVGTVDVQTRQVVPMTGPSKSPVRGLAVDSARNQLIAVYADGLLAVIPLMPDNP